MQTWFAVGIAPSMPSMPFPVWILVFVLSADNGAQTPVFCILKFYFCIRFFFVCGLKSHLRQVYSEKRISLEI